MFFFFNDTATTEIYTLSLHDALPISPTSPSHRSAMGPSLSPLKGGEGLTANRDRKSTRLNSSHGYISYAVFCLKKKNSRHQIGLHTIINYLNSLLTITCPILQRTNRH